MCRTHSTGVVRSQPQAYTLFPNGTYGRLDDRYHNGGSTASVKMHAARNSR